MTINLEDINDCIGSPSKFRIFIMLMRHGPMTVHQMMDEGVDVPQTTLYRLLNWMQERGLVSVVSETKVRAMTERTYDLSDDMRNFNVDVVRNNDLKGYSRMFMAFAYNLMREFEEYADRQGANIEADGSQFTAVKVFATREEYEDLKRQMRRTLGPYTVRRSPDQRMRTAALILAPPSECTGGDQA